jgi:hypothetical protein
VGLDRYEERFIMKAVKHPPKSWSRGTPAERGVEGWRLEFLNQGKMMNGGKVPAAAR